MKKKGKIGKYPGVALLGANSVGKTLLLRAITSVSNKKKRQNSDQLLSATIGFYKQEVPIESRMWRFTDIGGQERFQTALQLFVSSIDIFVIVVDVCNEKSWEKIEEYVCTILPTLRDENCIIRPDARMIIVANKIDLLLGADDPVSKIKSLKDNLVKIVREKNIYKNFELPIIETSALEKTNIDLLIDSFKYIYSEMTEARCQHDKKKKCAKYF